MTRLARVSRRARPRSERVRIQVRNLYFDPGDGRLITVVTNEERVPDAGLLIPEQLDALGFGGAREQFEANALGPLRIVSALLPRLGSGAKIGLVSSKAGPIGDRPSGGTYGYRMSKAALNMAGADLAHELAPRGIHVLVLHPGFVRTEMTGGAGGVDPPESAAGLIARIDELDADRSGHFFHANGDEIPW